MARGLGMVEKIKKIIAEHLSVDEDTLTLETSLKEDLGADSLDLFEVIMGLEEEFEIEVATEDVNDVNTIEDIINYLKNKGIDE